MEFENPLAQEIEQAQLIYNQLVAFLVEYSMQVVGAIIIVCVGYFIARWISRWLTDFLVKRDVDVTMSGLIGSFAYFGVLFCFIVIALGKVGVSITPFVAALGAFTLGAGLAIQGIVSNYGAGLSIIFTKPFVVGNTLTVQGVSGVVEEIRLPYTILVNEVGERITIPNREIIGQILENSYQYKLIESIVTIEAEADPVVAIKALDEAIRTLDVTANEPAAQVGIDKFLLQGISLGVRCWVPTASYYDAKYQLNAAIYESLRKARINLATPRQEIQLRQPA